MNYTRIVAAAVAAWLVSIPLGAVIHHGILGGLYAANATVFRPDPEVVRRLPIGFGVQLIGFFAGATMYAQGYAGGRGIAEGLRFGLLIGVVLVSFAAIWNYVTQPISVSLGIAEIFECTVEAAIYGMIIGVIYRPLGVAAAGRAIRA
jgi:hypothetical protein